MPAMPRFSKKGTKIAFKILGVPGNMRSKPTKKEKDVNRQLVFQETSRVK